APLDNGSPGCFTQTAIWIFLVASHLLKSLFLAFELNRQRAHDFLIALRQFGFLGLKGYVLLTEQVDVVLKAPVHYEEAISVKLSPCGRFQKLPLQPVV